MLRNRNWRLLAVGLLSLLLLGADEASKEAASSTPAPVIGDREVPPANAAEPAPGTPAAGEPAAVARRVHYLSVPLPITSTVVPNIVRTVRSMLADGDTAAARPLFVFEFRPKEGSAGEGTEVEQALTLARFLISDELNGVRTVAYLPQSVRGHSVLPILACEEIVMSPDAELGEAGLDEPSIDQMVRSFYTDIAEKRRTLPPAVVLGMLDREMAVYRVQTVNGVRYADQKELDRLQAAGEVTAVDTMIRPGELGKFSGRDLRLTYGFVSHLAEDRNQLAAALQIAPLQLEEDPSGGKPWSAIRVDLSGPIHSKNINWLLRSLGDHLSRGQVNLVCLVIDSSGGSFTDSLRLADYLAGLPSHQVRTVAYVSGNARADAALVALACDHLVVNEDSILGGPGDAFVDDREIPSLHESVKSLARLKGIDWSLPVALIDPSVVVYKYVRNGGNEIRIFHEEELATMENAPSFERGGEVETRQGLTGRTAHELGVARYLVTNFEELRQLYHLEDDMESLHPNWAHVVVEHLADPRLSGLLLFVAWFALMVEFMTPGIGIAGFISGTCFLLYFWANYLHGTAGWLEILLFVVGATCVLLEIFALPGMGVFGIGGGLMMVASIVLASQTFVVPRNSYQLSQLPSSLFMVVAAGAGAMISVAAMRRYLPETPVLNRLMLAPPSETELHELQRRELLVNYDDLLGEEGVATTRLLPGGKARIGQHFVDVLTAGEIVDPGTRIKVVEVRGNHILVRPV